MDLVSALIVGAAGLACGVVNSIAGGGTLILFPVLLLVGLPPLQANVTNSVATWPGYVGGVIGFSDEIGQQRRRLPAMIAATLVGSTVGCVLLLATPSEAFDIVVPVLVLVAALLTAVQPLVRRSVTARAASAAPVSAATVIGLVIATFYGGYFGAALGVIVLGVLGLTTGETLRECNASKSVVSLVDASVSVVIFGLFGNVSWGYVAVAAPTALAGGYVGAGVAKRMNERLLRVGVVTLGVTASIVLFIRALNR
ncbi:MAG: sulfite exporter TauE/SafE family protein [Ilumatobacteraceae bacterium]